MEYNDDFFGKKYDFNWSHEHEEHQVYIVHGLKSILFVKQNKIHLEIALKSSFYSGFIGINASLAADEKRANKRCRPTPSTVRADESRENKRCHSPLNCTC